MNILNLVANALPIAAVAAIAVLAFRESRRRSRREAERRQRERFIEVGRTPILERLADPDLPTVRTSITADDSTDQHP